jgi:polysaccharide biosynthesis transport protein
MDSNSKNELQNLQSDLQIIWLAIKRRWRPASIVFVTLFGLSVLYTATRKPEYEAKGKILLERSSSASQVTESGRQIGELRTIYGNPIDNEAEKIRSIPLIQQLITSLDLKDDQGEPLEPETVIKKNLGLEKIRGTDVLLISYQSKNPIEAAAVVNKLIALYQKKNIQTDREKVISARDFIESRLPITEAALKHSETELRKFHEQNTVVNLDQEAGIAVKAVADLEQQIGGAQVQLQRSQARSNSIRKLLGSNQTTAFDLSKMSQTPGVQSAIAQLQDVQKKLEVSRTKYADSHPEVKELRSQVTTLKKIVRERSQGLLSENSSLPKGNWQTRGLQEELSSEYVKQQIESEGLMQQIASLKAQQLAKKERLQLLPLLEQKQRQLETQVNASRSTYELLLNKLQEIRIAENQNTGNAKVIEAALVPTKIMLKPVVLKIALGLFAGILGAITTILLLELRDKTLKTVKEVQELFGYPLLGIIPTLEESETVDLVNLDVDTDSIIPNLIVRELPRSPISESYRMLLSNLRFLNSDHQLKRLVVTSSTIGEGKSTISANLAMVLAQKESRVLLIDADMRRPMQHHIWGLTNESGLSHVLVGVKAEIAIKSVYPNLDVLTAGVVPPDPGALLDSQRMSNLLEQFSDQYDFVIVDTPSLGVADEPRILGKMTDGILLVTRPGVTDTKSAQTAKALLSQIMPKILGLVVNGVMPEHEPHSYYYIKKYGYETSSEDWDKYRSLSDELIKNASQKE